MTIYHEELFEVAARDDAERLLALLPADINASDLRNRDGTSLILQCLYSGARKSLEQLCALFPERSFHEAAALGDINRIQALIEGAPGCMNLLSADGWTALHLAAFFGHVDTVRFLLNNGADPHLFSRAFETNIPLQAACASGAVEAALLLVDRTAAVDEAGPSGTTALMIAAQNGLSDVVDALLARGANAHHTDASGKSACDYAKEAGHEGIASRVPTQ